jgi:endonuclease YncB( thermonuclease family)
LPNQVFAAAHHRWIPAFAGLTLAAVVAIAGVAQAQEIVPPADRNVTPPGITPGPSGEGPLIREPTPPPPPEQPRWRRYFLPVTIDAATFVIDGKLTIRVSGATPPEIGDTCTFAGGETWPCGRTALHALRMFLRGRAIECLFPYAPDLVEVTAPCRVGETDIGTWLLRSGWARPNDLATEEYRTVFAEARCANVGLWQGAGRPADCPALQPPAELQIADVAPGSPWIPD